MTIRTGACAVGAALALALPGAAAAAINPAPDPGGGAQIATAIDTTGSEVTGGSYTYITPAPLAPPNGIADAPIGPVFPTEGATFAVLTNGDARFADDPNANFPDLLPPGNDDTGFDLNGGFANDGPTPRGTTDYDVTVARVDFNAPASANCLTLDFQFFSEEFADYVGEQFNDAFIAELDNSTWTTSASTITAPDNFAFDQAGNAISVNSVGVGGMTLADAAGTTYDGATQLLSASKQVAPGPHALYLSIFDQGDQVYDSAVFVDGLRIGFVPDPQINCVPGARLDVRTPDTTITAGPDNLTIRDPEPKFEFVSDDPTADFECRFNGEPFQPCLTPFVKRLADGFYDFEVRAVDPSGNVDPTPALRHFEIFTGHCAGRKIDIFVNPGQVEVSGTSKSDVMLGSPERDVIRSGGGNDVVCDREGNDVLRGGGGDDKLRGGPGDDKILGQTGDDLLSGRSGNDKLSGGAGEDFLNGNPGNDVLNGGPDDDTCKGGSGKNKLLDCN